MKLLKTLGFVFGVFGLTSCQAASQNMEVAQMDLAGSEWGTSVERQFVQFGADGKITGNGGCNRFFGTYTQDGNMLKVGPLGSTKMACANLRQEQAFFEILNTARTIEATHTVLVLKGENNTPLLTLQRRDWD